jgi:hypothetical protein
MGNVVFRFRFIPRLARPFRVADAYQSPSIAICLCHTNYCWGFFLCRPYRANYNADAALGWAWTPNSQSRSPIYRTLRRQTTVNTTLHTLKISFVSPLGRRISTIKVHELPSRSKADLSDFILSKGKISIRNINHAFAWPSQPCSSRCETDES